MRMSSVKKKRNAIRVASAQRSIVVCIAALSMILLLAACKRKESAEARIEAAQQLSQRQVTLTPGSLYHAIKNGDADSVALLIRAGAVDVTRRYNKNTDHGPTWLALAAAAGSLPVVERIADAGAPIDDRGEYGMTALHWAALEGHDDVVKFLVDHKAQPDSTDEKLDDV